MDKNIRKAAPKDISRLAEILVFTKRMTYRPIFRDDQVSFGEIQVLPLAQEYLADPGKLEKIWVYDDEFVKGMIHIEGERVQELYVEPFFQGRGIGTELIDFAVRIFDVKELFVLEKNKRAVQFYQSHGFYLTTERRPEEGTTEYIIKMKR